MDLPTVSYYKILSVRYVTGKIKQRLEGKMNLQVITRCRPTFFFVIVFRSLHSPKNEYSEA